MTKQACFSCWSRQGGVSVVLDHVWLKTFKALIQGCQICSLFLFFSWKLRYMYLEAVRGKGTILKKGAENTHTLQLDTEKAGLGSGNRSRVSLYLTTDTLDQTLNTNIWPLFVPHITKSSVISSCCVQNLHMAQNLRLVANEEWYWGVCWNSGIQQCMRKLH